MHTAILDEASSVAEPSLSPVLALRPRNLLLVGDPKQLPPFSHLSNAGVLRSNLLPLSAVVRPT